jgi:hypothetical protein
MAAGSVNASASIITRPILVFMFILFFKQKSNDFNSGLSPVVDTRPDQTQIHGNHVRWAIMPLIGFIRPCS